MPTGVVKWFNKTRHFGFIVPDDGGPEVFVHARALPAKRRTLQEGQPVEFDVFESPRGAQAANLRLRHGRGRNTGGAGTATRPLPHGDSE